MLLTIKIADDFENINSAYKTFKKSIFKQWCESDQLSFQIEEKKLFNSIKLILQNPNQLESDCINENISDENLLRSLIGVKILSKYSILFKDECVHLLSIITSKFPKSIQKRKFFIKYIIKCSKNHPNFSNDFKNRIFQSSVENPNELELFENTLIYINFLFQYSPDQISQFSSDIFPNLLKIISKCKYILDFSYNIKKMNELTENTDQNEYFSNAAIELLRKIFSSEKLINFQTIDMAGIFEWEALNNALAVMCVIFETCERFLGQHLYGIYRSIMSKESSEQEIQCLIARVLIFFSTIQEDIMNNGLLMNIFEFDYNSSDILLCGRLQNLKLLLQLNHKLLQNISSVEFVEIIMNCYKKNSQLILYNCLDLLNSCLIYNNERRVAYFEIYPEFVNQLYDQKLFFKFNEIIKLMFEINQEKFIEKLIQLISESPLDVLRFFGSKNKNEERCFIIKNMSEESRIAFVGPICDLMKNSDQQIRCLVPSVIQQIYPLQFFSFDNLYHTLVCDSSLQVQLSFILCFNKYLKRIKISEYPRFDSQNSIEKMASIFRNIVNCSPCREIRKETVKLICKLSKTTDYDFFTVFNSYLLFFDSFSNKNKINLPFNIDNYIISLQKLSLQTECLPLIFESFPDRFKSHFQSFYDFSMDFMNITSNIKDNNYQNKSRLFLKHSTNSAFKKKFYEIINCSFLRSFKIILLKNKSLIDPYLDEVINFCIKSLYYGSCEQETICILSFLELCLNKIGIENALKFNEINNQTNLFQIVFNTGSRFMSSSVHELVFKILGFLGAQPLCEKQKPIYDDDESLQMNELLRNEMINFANFDMRENISYIICSNSLFRILEDNNQQKIHFSALEALINIMKITYSQKKNYDFEHSFRIFKKLEKKSFNENKKKFIPLLESLCKIQVFSISDYIGEMVDILIDLWDYGSITIVKTFSSQFQTKLTPYLNGIIPLIRCHSDIDTSLDILAKIYTDCLRVSTDVDSFDIISIFIQMVRSGKYQALFAIINVLPCMNDLPKYIPSIVQICIDCINHFKLTQENRSNLAAAIKILIKLMSYDSPSYSSLMNSYKPLIEKTIKPFASNMKGRFINNTFRNKKFIREVESMQKSESSSSFATTDFNFNEFLSTILSIKDIHQKKINHSYIQQWLKDLVSFCIKNSPIGIIRTVFPIAKSSQAFAFSIFNAAFHSCYYEFISYDNFKADGSNLSEISKIFLEVLKSKNISSKYHSIISSLVEYMDREGDPLINLNNIDLPITNIFLREPPLSLRFTLLRFDTCLSNYNHMKKYLKEAAIDLGQAFLNVGSLDHYQQFSKYIVDNFKDITPLNSTVKYHLPIFANSINDNHHLKKANNKFVTKEWNSFYKEIEKFNMKIISHLYKTAALIQQYNDSNSTDENLKNEILSEIRLGFNGLAREGGPHFSQGFTSVLQYIFYGQQLIELQELFASKNKSNNFQIRFLHTDQMMNYLPPVLLLRMAAKGQSNSSFEEKRELLSLYRKTNNWELMNEYYNYFYPPKAFVPIEIQYEMMYCKLANNTAVESEFDSLLEEIQKESEEIKDSANMIKFVKYQKAMFYAHSQQKEEKLEDIISLCKDFDHIDAISLWSLANLKLFESSEMNNKSYLNNAIHGYIECALKSVKTRISNILMIVSLLFKYYNVKEASDRYLQINSIKYELNKLPLHFYIEAISQIISYIPSLKKGSFRDYIKNLLLELFRKYPQGVIYDYSFSILCDERIKNGTFVFSPINDIKIKCIRENQVFRKIFTEVFELTDNLYKITSDIHVITFEFVETILNFLYYLEETEVENEEISFFIDGVLEFYSKEYMNPVNSYFTNSNMNKSFEPNTTEKEFLQAFHGIFDSFSNSIDMLKNNLTSLLQARNNQDNKEIDTIKTFIFDTMKSNFNQFYVSLKCYQKEFVNNLFDLSPKMKLMRNMSLPVFGTYKYDNEVILIKEFVQEFTLFDTLKSPKKITIVGSDGHYYSFILKATEDLRLDQRIMIFNKFMNQFVSKKIKTYSITPLTTRFGVIQFVNEMTTLHQMIVDYRKKIGFINHEDEQHYLKVENYFLMNNIDVQEPIISDTSDSSFSSDEGVNSYDKLTRIQHLEIFRNLLNQTSERKNDLRESFWSFSPSSESWFVSTVNYTKTCAVTSIVGYIIGLGDRHTGNIMISKNDGNVMHIDFCDSFEVNQQRIIRPEQVPFRLTRNMTAAFGPCGSEGLFRAVCEETLSVIRENRDAILNMMKVFVDSPVFDGGRTESLTKSKSEVISSQKKKSYVIRRLSEKVDGTDNSIVFCDDYQGDCEKKKIPVGEHVTRLIQQASDEYNLAVAFSGWRPWI